jgi:hypothetical protein
MKIRITLELPADNQIQFCDVLKGAADKLNELADKAIDDGDHRQFAGTHHEVLSDNDDRDNVGLISVGE